MADLLQAGETLEDLQLNGLRLIQKKDAFRFGMDTVLLADFADIRGDDTVCDLGTGNGALIFLLRGRNKGKHYYALDIQEEAAELTRRNAVLNEMAEQVTVIHADAGEAIRHIPGCSVDAAVCNPPYGQPAASLVSPNKSRAVARSQDTDTLDRLLRGAFLILKGKGKIFLVYPATQMLYLMERLRDHHLEPKRFRMVYPAADKNANLALIEAVKDARPMLHTSPPLIIYEKDGSPTEELKEIYGERRKSRQI